jgi:hypothetical protein
MATIITIAGEKSPAYTAACPITSVPTMETDCAMALGILTPVSRKISKAISIMSASTYVGTETPSR